MVANRINEGTVISGDISAQTDIRLDGTIMGNIICSSKVVIGSNAHITGHITCNDLTIEGRRSQAIPHELLSLCLASTGSRQDSGL